MDSLSLLKCLSFIIMFLLIILTGNIPLRMKSFSSNPKLISLTSAFSGGLFLSVSLIHLAPQANKKFEEYYNGTPNHGTQDHGTPDHEMNQNQLETSVIEDAQLNNQVIDQHSSHSSMNSDTSEMNQGTQQTDKNTSQSDNAQKMDHSSMDQNQMDHSQMNNHQTQMNSSADNMNQNETNDQHMMNNNQHSMNEDMSSMKENFPFSMLIAVLSYTFMLMLEKIIIKQSVCNHNSLNLPNKQEIVNDQLKIQNQCQNETNINQSKNINKINNDDQNTIQLNCINNSINVQKKDSQAPCEGGVLIINQKLQFDLESPEKTQQKGVLQNFDKLTLDKSPEEQQSKQYIIVNEVSNQKLLSIALIQFTFGLHAILEGISIGVQQQLSSAITIFAVILAHKWAMGLILGMTLKDSQLTLRFSTFMIILQSLMNPIGIAIGWALTQTGNLTIGILLSISAGTFLYISINSIIVDEFNQDRYKLTKSILYLIGIGLVAFLWNIENMSGGHSH